MTPEQFTELIRSKLSVFFNWSDWAEEYCKVGVWNHKIVSTPYLINITT